MVDKAPGYYAQALRAIGQDLAELVPENLAIEHQSDNLVAHGLCTKSRFRSQNPTTGERLVSLWKKLFSAMIKRSSREPDLEFVPFSRTYSNSDIERLDHQGTKERNRTGLPDIYTLGERLRTIGKVIDSHNGRIVRIFKDLHQINFEYQDAAGNSRKEELSNTELYQLQQRYAAERGGSNAAGSAKE